MGKQTSELHITERTCEDPVRWEELKRHVADLRRALLLRRLLREAEAEDD